MDPLTLAITDTRLAAVLLKTGGRFVMLALPLVVLALTYVFSAFVLAPDTHSSTFHSAYQWFFSAAAQALPTLLVALALQANLFTSPGVKPAAVIGVVYIMLGEVAAVASLGPGLKPTLELHAFCITVSAGVAALMAVLIIAVKQLSQAPVAVVPSTDGANAVLERPETGSAGAPGSGSSMMASKADPGSRPLIALAPAAADDLKNLGSVTQRLTLQAIQEQFESGAEGKLLADKSGWRSLRLGNLRVLYRPTSDDQSTQPGDAAADVIVARVVDRRELPAVTTSL